MAPARQRFRDRRCPEAFRIRHVRLEPFDRPGHQRQLGAEAAVRLIEGIGSRLEKRWQHRSGATREYLTELGDDAVAIKTEGVVPQANDGVDDALGECRFGKNAADARLARRVYTSPLGRSELVEGVDVIVEALVAVLGPDAHAPA